MQLHVSDITAPFPLNGLAERNGDFFFLTSVCLAESKQRLFTSSVRIHFKKAVGLEERVLKDVREGCVLVPGIRVVKMVCVKNTGWIAKTNIDDQVLIY